MGLLKKIELANNFSPVEHLLGKYVLENGEAVLNMTTKELAKVTYTSPASVVRFCRRLEYDGYNDFKIALAAQLQYSHMSNDDINANYPFKKTDTVYTVASNIANLSKKSIDITMKNLDLEELRLVVQMINKASVVDIYGVSGPLRIASDFQYKMFRIGKDVRINQMINEQLFQAAQSTTEHLAILISYSGETDEVIDAAKILYRRKVPAIAITSFGQNRLTRYCQRVLYLNSSEYIYSKIATFASTLSLHLLLDIIYGCVFSNNYDENLNYKIETDSLIDHRQSMRVINK